MMFPLEDVFQKKLCICNHSINEEHEDGICYALDTYGGNVHSACRCTNVKPKSLVFKIERDEISNTSTNKSTKKQPTKSIKPISTFNWGSKKNSPARA